MRRLPGGRLAWLLAGVLVAGALAVFAWRARALPVPAVSVHAAALVRSVVVTGRVANDSRVFLGATITGRVREVAVREGERLRAGQLAIRLDDTEQASALRQAEAALAGARSRLTSQRQLAGPLARQQLEQARANAQAAERERERSEELHRQGFIGQARLDEARRAAEVARSQLDAARTQAQAQLQGSELEQVVARVAEAEAALDVARSRLAHTRIVAPADGLVLTRLVEPGQIVQPGARLLEMNLDGPVRLVAQVDEKFLAQIAPGQSARVVADAFPAQPFGARVASVAPGVDAQRGSIEVKFAPDELPAFLRSDMTLSIEVVTARRENALAVPPEALRGEGAVLVIEDGRAASRRVRTGLRTLQAVEVIEGLREGEQVIVGGAVTPGRRVRAVEPASRAAGSGTGEGVGAAMSGFGR